MQITSSQITISCLGFFAANLGISWAIIKYIITNESRKALQEDLKLVHSRIDKLRDCKQDIMSCKVYHDTLTQKLNDMSSDLKRLLDIHIKKE